MKYSSHGSPGIFSAGAFSVLSASPAAPIHHRQGCVSAPSALSCSKVYGNWQGTAEQILNRESTIMLRDRKIYSRRFKRIENIRKLLTS